MSSPKPPPASPAPTSLARTRSLRRPQIGVSAVGSSMAQPGVAARRLPSPSKQLPTMSTRIGSGVMPGRLRRTATVSASTTTKANTSPTRAAPARSLSTRMTAASSSSTSSSTSSRYYPPSSSSALRRPSSSDEPPSPTKASSGPAVPHGRLLRTATLPAPRSPGSTGSSGGYQGRTRSTTVTRGPSPLSTVSTTATLTSRTSRPAKPAKTTSSATALTAAIVLRPPSAESSSASSSTTTATTTTSASKKSRTTPPASLHRRQRSATIGSTLAPSVLASGSGSGSTSSTSSSRPAFSTLQQHYSPAKSLAPKPRTAAILAPPSPSKRPANVALSAETARLQTVLLQLHLLHRDSAVTTAAWHASARELLGRRFAMLAAADIELARAAAVQVERANAAALQRWKGGGIHTLDENVQALDEVLAGVWSLAVGAGMVDSSDHHYHNNNNSNSSSSNSSSNRYGRVVRRFERWAERTAALVEARRQAVKNLEEGDESEDDEDDDEDGSSLLLLLPGESHKDPALVLDAAWHADCANLTRKLEGWQRQLDMLGDGNMNGGGGKGDGDGLDGGGTSSLDRILGGCRRLVDDMLAELNVMQQLERDAAEQELAWIRRMNSALDGRESTSRQLSDSISSIGSIDSIGWAAPRAGAIWRVM